MTVFRADAALAALTAPVLGAIMWLAAPAAAQAPDRPEQTEAGEDRPSPPRIEPRTGQDPRDPLTGAPVAGDAQRPGAAAEEEARDALPRTRRYYLGPGPQGRDEADAPIAQEPPRSILVGPYLPEGAIAVPGVEPATGQDAPLAGDGLTGEEADEALAADIQVDTLEALDTASVGVWEAADAPPFPVDMWAGTGRPTLETLLPALPMQTASPIMDALARRLLLSPARVPAGPAGGTRAESGDRRDLLQLRLERLAAGGELDDLLALSERVPAAAENEDIRRLRTDALLVLGDYEAACGMARNAIADSGAAHWLRIVAMCEALEGNRSSAMFRMSLLEEEGESGSAFSALVEALLAEIEGRPQTPDEGMLAGAQDLTPTLFALARLTQAPIPADLALTADPLVLGALVEAPALSMDVRLEAAERAVEAGLVDGSQLAGLFSAAEFTAMEKQSAMALLEAARSEGAAAPLTGLALDALLYQLAAETAEPLERTRWLRLAFERAREQGRESVIAEALLGPLAAVAPGPDMAFFADVAGRIELVAGNVGEALAWYDTARQAAAAQDAQATRALIDLWPLVVVTDSSETVPYSARILDLWWQGRAVLPLDERLARADILFGVLRALDYSVPEALWTQALTAPQPTGPAPPVALWQRMIAAATAQRLGESVLTVLVALGDAGPEKISPAAAVAVTGALARVGLRDEARRLALETLIARGF